MYQGIIMYNKAVFKSTKCLIYSYVGSYLVTSNLHSVSESYAIMLMYATIASYI